MHKTVCFLGSWYISDCRARRFVICWFCLDAFDLAFDRGYVEQLMYWFATIARRNASTFKFGCPDQSWTFWCWVRLDHGSVPAVVVGSPSGIDIVAAY